MKRNHICIYCFLLILFMLFGHENGIAVNKVKIATIDGGGGDITIDKTQDHQKTVGQMIKYWQGELIKVTPQHPDLILLTETCDSPSGLSTEEMFNYYRVRKNQILDYFASVAKSNHCYIAFGMKREDKGKWWNSSILLDRDGKIAGVYNKNFPTIYEMVAGITPGSEIPVFQCDFGRVAATICFDLNFDELREQYEKLNLDIILYSSAYHGGLEQSKWAYSCRSFFVCSFYYHNAPSEIRNPLGEVVSSTTNYFNYAITTINLDRKLVHLDYNWEKLIALKKKYGDEVTINDPGKLGCVMITSEKKGVTADDMIKEFKIEPLDDYFNDSRQQRTKYLNAK